MIYYQFEIILLNWCKLDQISEMNIPTKKSSIFQNEININR